MLSLSLLCLQLAMKHQKEMEQLEKNQREQLDKLDKFNEQVQHRRKEDELYSQVFINQFDTIAANILQIFRGKQMTNQD